MEDKKYKYSCDKCEYYTNATSSYKKHLNTEIHKTGKRKIRSDKKGDIYKCNICDFTSNKEHNYKTHILHNHSTKEKREKEFKYYCNCCDFGTFTESEYDKHMKTNKHKMKSI
jgi:ribosomal protein L35